MFRKTCFVLAISSGMAVVASTSYGQESVSVLNYLGQRAERLASQRAPVPETLDAWKEHRAKLVEALNVSLALPDREPMKAAVTDSKQDGDLTVEDVVYLWAEQTYVSATLIRSTKSSGRRPAVIIPSGWLGHYTFLPYRQFVDSLARQGFTVLFIDDPRTGRRQSPHAGLYATAAAAGRPVAGVQVFDVLRGFDYLLTRTDVDSGKIGIAGLGEGALQAYLAAALEERLQFVATVGGTTTYAALIQAAAQSNSPIAPSVFVAGILDFADMDRIAACLAPRSVLIAGSANGNRQPAAGYSQVLDTMKAVYGLHDAGDRIRQVPGDQPDDMTPYIPEILQWLKTSVLPSLESSDAAPTTCGKPEEEPDFSVLRFMQQRIVQQAASLPIEPASTDAWKKHRDETIDWLRRSCALESLKPAADRVIEVSKDDDVVTEQLALGLDGDFACPAVLVRPAELGPTKRPAVILSHDDRQCAVSAKIADAARQLVSAGYCVIVPDHASVHPQSLQGLANTEKPSFYGDDAARLYGPADTVGLSPLALRVAENLAAFRYLAAQSEIDPEGIVIAGLGTGSVDACLAAVLEDRIAGVASVGATTMRDWAVNVAPGELRFFHVMPYLPAMLAQTDWDCLYAAIAPRPLVVVRLKDGWPRSGFEQVVSTTSALYKLQQAEAALLALGPRDVTEQLERGAPEGIQKQLITAARTLVPTPPQPGIVGTVEGLKSRQTTDSASGLIWIVAEMSGYDQELAGEGYRLETWSFFNDNGDAQKDHAITPLVFKKEGDTYHLTGIGTTRTNAGTGLQTFPFEPVEGTDQVGDGHFFGWHTGNMKGQQNRGVAEFEDAPDALMIILTADGQLGGQKLKLGATYRFQSQYRRRYSVMAASKKP